MIMVSTSVRVEFGQDVKFRSKHELVLYGFHGHTLNCTLQACIDVRRRKGNV